MKAYPRESFSAEVTFTPPLVTTYAQAAGANNPVHHNPDFAAATDVGHAERTNVGACDDGREAAWSAINMDTYD